jgi:adenylosuccinate lyase
MTTRSPHEGYESPLSGRYAGRAMSFNWSAQKKHATWRRLWLELARAEQALGLPITDAQIAEMAAHLDDIDFAAAATVEKELRHDVMSHIHVFGERCPAARPIIHLGATSCYVTDNTELIQLRDGLGILRLRLGAVLAKFADFSRRHRDLPTLGFTHYQPAQLTTVGKRFCLYAQDFLMDLRRLEREADELPFRSVKGTTGTQASFLELFHGDHAKVRELERRVAAAMGFARVLPVSGQTYPRKIDYHVLAVLSGIAQSAAKFAGDLRLLANLREIEEPFGTRQVGSSAMAYKRNPMRSERICALARHLISLPVNAAQTHAGQWFERTLDDSANRRIVLPEAFLDADVILSLVANVLDGLQVWPRVIAARIQAELPFMATENILMAAVEAGGDRQELHEAIRRHSMAAVRRIKDEGADNDLIDRFKADPAFAAVADRFDTILEPRAFVGRAPEQVDEFLAAELDPVLARLGPDLQAAAAEEINV